MDKFSRFMLAASCVALANPATAAAVGANPPATASAKIVKPLSLTKSKDLDFGTVVLSSVTGTNVVAISKAGAVTCGAGGELVCSGTPTAAAFTVKGTNNIDVKILTAASTLNGPGGATLTFTPTPSTTMNLGATGYTNGVIFSVGGSISVDQNTVDGVYLGNMDVTVDY